jgi:hypothetical protein
LTIQAPDSLNTRMRCPEGNSACCKQAELHACHAPDCQPMLQRRR